MREFLIIFLLLCSAHLYAAQDQDSVSEQEQRVRQPAADNPQNTNSGASTAPSSTTATKTETQTESVAEPVTKERNKRPSDIFQPSEEISEDFAVSFPVDI